MNKSRFAVALISTFLAVAAATAQNATTSAPELLGEWSIVAMYGIDSGTVEPITGAKGTFSFEKRGKGSITNTDTAEAVELSWRASERDRSISISAEDSTRLEGYYTIQGSILVLTAVQDEGDAFVVVLARLE